MNGRCRFDSITRVAQRTLCGMLLVLLTAAAVRGQGFAEAEVKSDDLIRLVEAYAEGVQEYKSAELRVKTLRVLGGSANLTGLESQLAQIDLQVAQAKLEVLHAIGNKMHDAIFARTTFLRRLEQQNGQPAAADATANPQLRQAEADLRIIKMILAMYSIAPATVETAP